MCVLVIFFSWLFGSKHGITYACQHAQSDHSLCVGHQEKRCVVRRWTEIYLLTLHSAPSAKTKGKHWNRARTETLCLDAIPLLNIPLTHESNNTMHDMRVPQSWSRFFVARKMRTIDHMCCGTLFEFKAFWTNKDNFAMIFRFSKCCSLTLNRFI